MAELRRRRRTAIHGQVAAKLRESAERYRDRGADVYEFFGAPLVKRAEEIELGDRPVVVHGWELPESARGGLNPSSPYLLHPGGRLSDWQSEGVA